MSEELRTSLLEQSFLDSAITYAIERNPILKNVEQGKLTRFAGKAISEMVAFEELARTNQLRVPETAEEASRIKAVWDLSFVGTYLKEFQDDRWKFATWAGWTDRRRLNYSAVLIRKLTEKVTGKSYKALLGKELTPDQMEELRSDIEQFGPYLIYGATAEQNEDLETALKQQGAIIPQSRVHIIKGQVVNTNTVDQMKTFSLPEGLQIEEGDILAIVAHAPHMVRALHMMKRFKPFPEGLIVQPHPLISPPSAGTNLAMMEISGLLYYTYITGDSSEESYPFQI